MPARKGMMFQPLTMGQPVAQIGPSPAPPGLKPPPGGPLEEGPWVGPYETTPPPPGGQAPPDPNPGTPPSSLADQFGALQLGATNNASGGLQALVDLAQANGVGSNDQLVRDAALRLLPGRFPDLATAQAASLAAGVWDG